MAKTAWITTTERSPARLRLVLFDWQLPAIAGMAGLMSLFSATVAWWMGTPPNLILLFLGALLVGLSLIWASRTSITLDKQIGILHIHRATIFGLKTRSTILTHLIKPDTRQRSFGSLRFTDLTLCLDNQDDWTIWLNELSGATAHQACQDIASWMHFFLDATPETEAPPARLDSAQPNI